MNAVELSKNGTLATLAKRWSETITNDILKKAATVCLKSEWNNRSRMEDIIGILQGEDERSIDDNNIAGLLLDPQWKSL